jgi:hypothetical protein
VCIARARGAKIEFTPESGVMCGEVGAAVAALQKLVYRLFEGKHNAYCKWSWQNGAEIVAEFASRAK